MTRRTAAPLDRFQVPSAVAELTDCAGADETTRHLRFVTRGKRILMVSCEPPDVEQHARFAYVGLDLWSVDIYSHTGRWQPTGMQGTPTELLRTLRDEFPWVVMSRDFPL